MHPKKNREDESMRMRNPRVTLASIESLSVPLVQEVVFLADYRCTKCQQGSLSDVKDERRNEIYIDKCAGEEGDSNL
ncbi:hypothetical protein HAX54_031960 [Datura stramonium]|uniref:Uncharacterized protein n=1 Tax=Datura stramonium TaxID=4076 RepID=A0ABS8VCT0_DATST|nr:hypothetical protein [Datura stramonium]